MGLFSKLFSTDSGAVPQPWSQLVPGATDELAPEAQPKGMPDAEGLYPGEIAVLYYAESLQVDQTAFPHGIYACGVRHPQQAIQRLGEGDYLRVGGLTSALPLMGESELKEIARAMGVNAAGSKADVVAAISKGDQATLRGLVMDRAWELTDAGRAALDRNAYVGFYLGRHEYATGTVDFWDFSRDCLEHPEEPYRDVFHRQLGAVKDAASAAITANPADCASHLDEYCECLRTMALFVEEEGRSYDRAVDWYFQYLYERINVHAGLSVAHEARFLVLNGSLDDDTIRLFTDLVYKKAALLPYQQEEMRRLQQEAGISDQELGEWLRRSFERAEHSGFMNASEAAEFVELELAGEDERARDLCRAATARVLDALGYRG